MTANDFGAYALGTLAVLALWFFVTICAFWRECTSVKDTIGMMFITLFMFIIYPLFLAFAVFSVLWIIWFAFTMAGHFLFGLPLN